MAAIDLIGEGQSFLGESPQIVKVRRVTVGFGVGDVEVVAQAVYPIFNVPANTLVLDVMSIVDTAFTATLTLDIGDGDDPDGWLATAKVAPGTAVTSGIHKRSTLPTAEAYAGGKLYAAADTIDVTTGTADADAGEIEILIVYIENYSAIN